MRKKNMSYLIAIIAIVAVVILGGCIDELIQPTPTPTPVPTPGINEERDLVKQWFQVHGEEFDENDLDEVMDEFKKWGIRPVEIYRGSLIFYAKSYGYIHIPEIDEERFPLDFGENEYENLVLEKGGTISVVFDNLICGCFPNLSGAEDFLAELWSTPVPTPRINEERDLVKQWFKMHIEQEELEDIEEGLDEFMDQLQSWDIHPVEIYRGSLIFYAKSYGYIHIPEIDEERFPLDFGENEYENLVLEKGGTISVVFDNLICGCFPNLSGVEDFLAELWGG